jgi:cytochrome-b5 reductase
MTSSFVDGRGGGENVLSTPLHGVYIPAGLLILGVMIMDWTKWPYAVVAAVLLGAFKFYRGAPTTIGNSYVPAMLVEKYPVSADTSIYEFELEKPTDRLGLRPGQHFTVRVKMGNGELVERCYTPLSVHSEGRFDLMIKTYERGTVSRSLDQLQQYQTIEVRVDPEDHHFNYVPNRYTQLNMVAGGTGITPMLQLIDTIVRNVEDKTKINLIYANDTIEDIPVADELNEMRDKYPYFTLKYLLRELPTDNSINATIGIVSNEVLEKHLLPPTENSLTLVCGPEKMCIAAEKPLRALGHEFFVF